MLDDDIRMRIAATSRGKLFIIGYVIPPFFLITVLLIVASDGGNYWLMGTSVFLLLLTVTTICGFLLKNRRIVEIALRASIVSPEDLYYLKELVEEVSLVSGFPRPELMYIDNNLVNAYSFNRAGKGLLLLTRGSIENLNRDELRTVIAHAIAKIAYAYRIGDIMKATLSALPAYSKAILGQTLGLVVVIACSFVISVLILGLVPLLLYFATKEGMGMIVYYIFVFLYGVSLFSNRRERVFLSHNASYLADELATKWTMYPEALVGAMHKAEQTDYGKALRFM
jgi:Zn-dependent protease with chaperone function